MGEPIQPNGETPKATDPKKAEADSKRFEESLKQMVSHADRMWKAEEQNAARIANRSNLALTAISAVIGLKLLAFGKEVPTLYALRGSWAWWTFMAAFGLSVACLLRALRLVLGSSWTKKDTSSSSTNLIIDKSIAESFLSGPKEDNPHGVIYDATTQAAADLANRNTKRSESVSSALWYFWLAVWLTIVSISSYSWLSIAGGSHGQQQLPPSQQGP